MRLPRKHRVRALRAVHGFPQLNVRKPLSLIQKLRPDSATRGLLRGPLNYCKFRERAQQACQKSVSHRRTGPQFFARDPPWKGVHQGAPQRKRGGGVGGWVGRGGPHTSMQKKGVLLLLLLWTPWGTAINTKGYSYFYFFGPPGVRQLNFSSQKYPPGGTNPIARRDSYCTWSLIPSYSFLTVFLVNLDPHKEVPKSRA